jgi:hypothetical protein
VVVPPEPTGEGLKVALLQTVASAFFYNPALTFAWLEQVICLAFAPLVFRIRRGRAGGGRGGGSYVWTRLNPYLCLSVEPFFKGARPHGRLFRRLVRRNGQRRQVSAMKESTVLKD